MPDFETLLWDRDGETVTVTLNRPEKRNAMSWRMFEEIGAAFESAGADPQVRCVVVTGAGGAFCSGADLTDPENLVATPLEMQERMRAINGVVRSVATCERPTIAKVTGVAAGAGCNLALLCDLVVASREARFAELFVKRGLAVDFGGTWALTRLLPLNQAKELALLGEIVSAEEAYGLGLVNRLCEPQEVSAVVKDLAVGLAALPPKTVSFIKKNLNRAAERSLDDNLEAESAAQATLITSEDLREALMAWTQKREPRFSGR